MLTNTQVSKLRKTFVNGSSANIEWSKTPLHKIRQSGGFLGRPLGSLLKSRLSLKQNVLKSLAKSLLMPFGLTATSSAANATIHKKMLESATTTLIISNKKWMIL